jgi:oxygen-independent coproporphyrinogen-3 oxidase
VRFEHLYVHVPFCARRCVYCDFSIAVRSTVPSDDYIAELLAEIDARHSASRFDLDTLYFGGGTPSKLGGEGVSRLMDAVRAKAHIRKDAEITLETNPEDVSAANVRDWKDAGINRVSLGIQSFDDSVLTWMHRTHDSRDALRAVQVLREGGISNISIDLIFAVPESLGRNWRRDLDTALNLDLPHVSLYGLTVESQTPLGRWVARKTTAEAPEDSYEAEFVAADELLTNAGYDHYEVSNYGKRGFHSRHNWAYWSRKPYAGLGPSAHEFDGRTRRWNASAYAEWVGLVRSGKDPIDGSEVLSGEQAEQESTYLGLRTNSGVTVETPLSETLARWVEAGWGTVATDSRLRLKGSGWLRLDSLASDLTAFRSRY